MASTYTSRLRLELQGNGENPNTWGQKLNQSVIELIDSLPVNYGIIKLIGILRGSLSKFKNNMFYNNQIGFYENKS